MHRLKKKISRKNKKKPQALEEIGNIQTFFAIYYVSPKN